MAKITSDNGWKLRPFSRVCSGPQKNIFLQQGIKATKSVDWPSITSDHSRSHQEGTRRKKLSMSDATLRNKGNHKHNQVQHDMSDNSFCHQEGNNKGIRKF